MGERVQLNNLATAPVSDDALVDALIAFANGAEVVICGQDPHFGEPRSREADRQLYVRLLEGVAIGQGRSPLPMLTDNGGRSRPAFAVLRLGQNPGTEALPPEIRGLGSVKLERVLLARPGGYSLGYFRQFDAVAAALAEAAVLVLDPERRYGKALCRCRYPDCKGFYLARRNPRGGPANRTYCDPEHRRLHNNSAARKAVTVPRRPK